jgi:hypothetical protein
MGTGVFPRRTGESAKSSIRSMTGPASVDDLNTTDEIALAVDLIGEVAASRMELKAGEYMTWEYWREARDIFNGLS